MLRVSPFFFLIILTGCFKKPENHLIGGQWKTNYNPEYGWWNRETFAFLNDSIVDTKHSPYFGEDSIEDPKYLGTKTRYKIEGDSLKIYDLSEHKWRRGEKVMKLTKDTLVLKRFDDSVKTFVKKFYDTSGKRHFDKITLSSFPGWLGPIVDIVIDRGGRVFLRVLERKGEAYYETNISKDQFDRLEENFLYVDQAKIKPIYFARGTDGDHYSTTFCSVNKITMSIYDYGPCGPDELIWAYSDLKYLYQELGLKEDQKLDVPSYVRMRLKSFEFDGEEISLTDSESFLLSWYLMSGRKVDDDFPTTYKGDAVAFYPPNDLSEEGKEMDKQLVKVESDGRRFRFYEPNKKPYAIDIGFNYLNENYRVFKERTAMLRGAF